MDGGLWCPPGGSEHLPDRHDVGGGVEPVEDRFDDLFMGSLTENTLDGDLFCPLIEPTSENIEGEDVGVDLVEKVFDLAQLGVKIEGGFPKLRRSARCR